MTNCSSSKSNIKKKQMRMIKNLINLAKNLAMIKILMKMKNLKKIKVIFMSNKIDENN